MTKPANLGYAAVRRIVTGHNEKGESIIVSDGHSLNVVAEHGKPVAQVLWATGEGRAVGAEPAPAGHKFGFHSEGGSLLRIVDFPPDESIEVKMAAMIEGQSIKGIWSARPKAGGDEVASGTLTAEKK